MIEILSVAVDNEGKLVTRVAAEAADTPHIARGLATVEELLQAMEL